tara:strand:- start:12260 stop:13126 length:867 start_codon:yes stop_codon:yes gene_type:complete
MAHLFEKIQRYSTALQMTPLGIALLLFLIGPIIVILITSFWKFNGFLTIPDFTVRNYVKLFTSGLTLDNYLETIRIAAIVWITTTVLGFIIAYYLVFDVLSLKAKMLLFLLCVVPFWTSGVIRMIAWIPFLGKEGVINRVLMSIGITDEPLEFLLFSEFAVILSYVHVFTLFMVAPLFNTMARIDPALIEAARDNGAKGWQILLHVIIPLCKPGIAIGTIFVLSLTLSDFTAVRLLSGANVGTVALSISNQIGSYNFAYSSANSLFLLIVLLLIVGGIMRLVDVRKQL